MIRGMVKSNEARIRLTVIGRQGQRQDIDAVVDSGFSGALSLPPALIETLNLQPRSVDRALLADGSMCIFQVYVGKVLWDGKVRRILVAEANSGPLAGMRLLKGFEVKMQVRARGKVTIQRLRAR